jgi:hypothetical protein
MTPRSFIVMAIQPVTPTPVHPLSTPTAHASTPSKPFSEHISQLRTSSAHPVTSASSPNAAASGASPTAAPGAAAPAGSTSDTSGVQASLDQSEDQNMQYLQFQSQVNDQSQTFTTLSNVMKTENDTLKNTAGNMAM